MYITIILPVLAFSWLGLSLHDALDVQLPSPALVLLLSHVHTTSILLLSLLLLLIQISHPGAQQARHELPHPLLIDLIILILPTGHQLREPSRRLKQDHVRHRAEPGPVVV